MKIVLKRTAFTLNINHFLNINIFTVNFDQFDSWSNKSVNL